MEEANLKISDFSILENAGCVTTTAGNFYSATHNSHINDKKDEGAIRSYKLPVTLLISSREQSMGQSNNQFSLSAGLCFEDDVDCFSNKEMLIPAPSDGKCRCL